MKNVLIVIIVIALIILGVWYFTAKKESTTDEISTVLENLKKATGIKFSKIKDVEIKWHTKTETQTVQGKGFEVARISQEKSDAIDSFFKDNGFEIDMYNIAAGTVVDLTGYAKDNIGCHVIVGVTGYKEAEGQWVPPEPDLTDADVRCGEIEIRVID